MQILASANLFNLIWSYHPLSGKCMFFCFVFFNAAALYSYDGHVHVYWGLQGVTEFIVATDETGWKWGFAMNADIVWKEV